jgi:E3 ubiquitin-protein ligase RNF144
LTGRGRRFRLAKRGQYDPLTAERAIATIGPHDTDALVDYLENLTITEIEQTTTASGEKLCTRAACEEQLPASDLILASCGHCHCRSCVGIMFDAATKDESCYPPKCCKDAPIPVEHAKRLLDPELEAKFEKKAVEFETVNRTYCSNPGCSIFMPPAEIDCDTVVCPSCSERTCVTCKAPAHRDQFPADLELASLLKLAEEMR